MRSPRLPGEAYYFESYGSLPTEGIKKKLLEVIGNPSHHCVIRWSNGRQGPIHYRKNYVSNIMFRFGIEQNLLQMDEFFRTTEDRDGVFRTQEIGGHVTCAQEEALHRGRYWERWKLMFPLMRSIWYSGREFYEEALVNSTRDQVYAFRRKQFVGLNSFLLKHSYRFYIWN